MDTRKNTPMNKYIGFQIKRRRLFLGLSLSELAFYVGITFQQVQKYEQGINGISASNFKIFKS